MRHAPGIISEVSSPIETGQAALREGRWQEAISAFETVLRQQELPEVLEGMGEALWWVGDARFSVKYRERAYAAFRAAADPVRACRVAIDLCITYLISLGNPSASRGWLARAERTVEGVETNPLQGWLWLMRGFLTGNPEDARELMGRALDFGRASGDADLELVALGDLGLALVTAGRVGEGLSLLDEAMAATLAVEYTRPDTVVYATCDMLAACSLTGDLERATLWCSAADEFTSRYGSPFMYATCRVHYGGVLIDRGRWAQAEDELESALEMARVAAPGARTEALARLADLRLRQGRLDEAEALLASLRDDAATMLPSAALRLARGEPEIAVFQLVRRLDHLGDHHIEAAESIALLVDAHLAAGDLSAAEEVASRLRAVSEAHELAHAAALASLASAHLAAARGEDGEAITHLETALNRLTPLDLPLERARVRLELAEKLGGSRPKVAVEEARRALDVFEELGAELDADRAASVLRRLGAPGRTGPKRLSVLTKREEQVLALIARGLTNPEIAERLYISRKTAAHHVSRVLTKLGLRNRAEAAAYATLAAHPGRTDSTARP